MKLTREEKLKIMNDVWYKWWRGGRNLHEIIEAMLDAIEPPKIKVGMWGRFNSNTIPSLTVYGEVTDIRRFDAYSEYAAGNVGWFRDFTPLPGLGEAIDKLEGKE